MSDYEEYLQEKPDYIDTVRKIVEYEENNKEPDAPFIKDMEYESCWEATDVPVSPQKAYQLEVNGLVERVFDTNSTTSYSLIDRDAAREAISEVEELHSEGRMTKMHDFPDEDELPEDLFDDVIGHDDVKWLLRRGMTTDKITNFLLVGPPGSAKTVFLLCIQEISDAEFVDATQASGSGFMEVLFDKTPKYMLIDELDDMDQKDQRSLSSYSETGIVKETKFNKTREMKTNTKTLATANDTSSILDHIVDRFTTINFEPYDRGEYVEVCEHILPRKEGKTQEEANKIANAVWEQKGEGDVRQAIQVARLSRGDPEKVIKVLEDRSFDEETSLLG